MTTPTLTVHVLTHCADPVFAYGSLLSFSTIRVGFPTARIEVVDNGSHAEMVPRIRAAAQSVGASFEARPLVHWADHWRHNLFERKWPEPHGPVVFIDPDCAFFENCEAWLGDFDGALMAGMLEPAMDVSPRRVQGARLHPSFLVVPDIGRLRDSAHPRGADYVKPREATHGGVTTRYDTLGKLYAVLSDQCRPFEERHLDSYAHLHYGSHLPAIRSVARSSVYMDAHRAAANGDLAALKGLWRRQAAVHGHPPDLPPGERPVTQQIRDWQGLDISDAELEGIEYRLRARLQLAKPAQ